MFMHLQCINNLKFMQFRISPWAHLKNLWGNSGDVNNKKLYQWKRPTVKRKRSKRNTAPKTSRIMAQYSIPKNFVRGYTDHGHDHDTWPQNQAKKSQGHTSSMRASTSSFSWMMVDLSASQSRRNFDKLIMENFTAVHSKGSFIARIKKTEKQLVGWSKLLLRPLKFLFGAAKTWGKKLQDRFVRGKKQPFTSWNKMSNQEVSGCLRSTFFANSRILGKKKVVLCCALLQVRLWALGVQEDVRQNVEGTLLAFFMCNTAFVVGSVGECQFWWISLCRLSFLKHGGHKNYMCWVLWCLIPGSFLKGKKPLISGILRGELSMNLHLKTRCWRRFWHSSDFGLG